MTILFSVLLFFTMKNQVDAKDLPSGSSSILSAIPLDLIAIITIVPLLIILALLAKHYHRSRYDASTAENLEPAFIPNVKTRSFQDNLLHLPVEEERLPSMDKNSSIEVTGNRLQTGEREKVISIKPATNREQKDAVTESPAQLAKKESNVIYIIAKGLLIIGILLNYFLLRRQREKKE